MRILHIGKYYPPDYGGMESFVRALALEQAGSGHEVFVLCHAGKAGPGLEHPAPRLTVRRCRVQWRISGYAPVAVTLPLHLLLRSGVRPESCAGPFRPDVIHAHSPNVAANWPVFAPVPLVLHWHSDVMFSGPGCRRPPSGLLLRGWRMLEKIVLRRANRIVVTSRDYLESSLFLQPHREKCRVVPLALARNPAVPVFDNPASAFLRARPEQGCLNMLAVGRLSHYKGFECLLRAMILAPLLRLCLVGGGEEEANLKRLARHPDLERRVWFAGELEDGEVRACLQTCDVLVLPSTARTEAFGLVLLEAMREGVPCVACDVPGSGMGSVVRHGRTGLLVQPGDVCGLGKALCLLAADSALRRRLGETGRKVWEQEYCIGRVREDLDFLYAEAIADQQHRGRKRKFFS